MSQLVLVILLFFLYHTTPYESYAKKKKIASKLTAFFCTWVHCIITSIILFTFLKFQPVVLYLTGLMPKQIALFRDLFLNSVDKKLKIFIFVFDLFHFNFVIFFKSKCFSRQYLSINICFIYQGNTKFQF